MNPPPLAVLAGGGAIQSNASKQKASPAGERERLSFKREFESGDGYQALLCALLPLALGFWVFRRKQNDFIYYL